MAVGFRPGGGNQLTAADRTGLDWTSTGSIALWLRTTVTNVTLFTHDNTTGAADGYTLTISSAGQLILTLYNGAAATQYTGPLLPAVFKGGQWYHVGCTADGSFVKFYINGFSRASVAQTTTATTSANRTTELLTATTSAYHDVRVWAGRAISAGEMRYVASGLRLGDETARWLVGDARTGLDYTGNGHSFTMGSLVTMVENPRVALLPETSQPFLRSTFRSAIAAIDSTPISEDNYFFPMQVTAQKRVVTVFA